MENNPNTQTPSIPTLKRKYSCTNQTYMYKDWLEMSVNELGYLDYFEFADRCDKSESTTNAHFTTIIKNLSKTKKKNISDIAVAFNKQYQKKKNVNTAFGRRYHDYWKERNIRSIQGDVSSRQSRMIEQLNNDACTFIETVSKRRHIEDLDDPKTSLTTPHVATVAKELSSLNERVSVINKNASELITNSIGYIHILDLDACSKYGLLEEHLTIAQAQELYNKLEPPTYLLSPPCQKLIQDLSECSTSPRSLINLARNNIMDEYDYEFDLYLHWDLTFVENITKHFLYLIQSPRNPLQQKCLERSTATLATIKILNNLFLINNDLVEFGWIERECRSIQEANWDGVAFCIDNNKLRPILIKFSGGVDSKSSEKKQNSDINKIYSKIAQVSDAINVYSENLEDHCLFIVRFVDLDIFFESFSEINGVKVKKTNCVLKCPTSPSKLKQFVTGLPSLFNWKASVINTATKLVKKY